MRDVNAESLKRKQLLFKMKKKLILKQFTQQDMKASKRQSKNSVTMLMTLKVIGMKISPRLSKKSRPLMIEGSQLKKSLTLMMKRQLTL